MALISSLLSWGTIPVPGDELGFVPIADGIMSVTHSFAGRHMPGHTTPMEWPIQTGKESWPNRAMTRQQKITFGEMRASGAF
jgi:hypothetical protein